jgi:hypothetical protein
MIHNTIVNPSVKKETVVFEKVEILFAVMRRTYAPVHADQ